MPSTEEFKSNSRIWDKKPDEEKDMPSNGGTDWEKNKIHVLAEIDRLDEDITKIWDTVTVIQTKEVPAVKEAISKKLDDLKTFLNKEFTKINSEIVTLKVKSGLWGALAGAIPAVVVLILMLIRSNTG